MAVIGAVSEKCNGRVVGTHCSINDRRLFITRKVQRDLKDGHLYFPKKIVEKLSSDGYVVVIVARGRLKRDIYISRASDLLWSEFAVKKWIDGPTFGLPLSRFAINPSNRHDQINRAIKIR